MASEKPRPFSSFFPLPPFYLIRPGILPQLTSYAQQRIVSKASVELKQDYSLSVALFSSISEKEILEIPGYIWRNNSFETSKPRNFQSFREFSVSFLVPRRLTMSRPFRVKPSRLSRSRNSENSSKSVKTREIFEQHRE